MFEVELKSAQRKRRRRGQHQVELKQPLPVPIATLTGIKAKDSIWRHYHGEISENLVKIRDSQEARYVYELGFFGSFIDLKRPRRIQTGLQKKKSKGFQLVTLDDSDPQIINLAEDDSFDERNTKECDPGSCDSDSEEADKDCLNLDFYEAFFLAFGLGCLIIKDNEEQILSIPTLWDRFKSAQRCFPERYAVYHHFRQKNFVVKDGTKYGADFLLYKDGPPFYHSSYSVRIAEQKELSWQSLSGLNRVTESAGKELLLAQISSSQCHCEEKPNLCKVKHSLQHIHIEEILVRRWVPSQEREK